MKLAIAFESHLPLRQPIENKSQFRSGKKDPQQRSARRIPKKTTAIISVDA